jgi:hypothetical protein
MLNVGVIGTGCPNCQRLKLAVHKVALALTLTGYLFNLLQL